MEQGIRIRTISLLCFIMAMWMPQRVSAQSCLPEGITFRTQSQIDSFPINHPNCTLIEGDVTIIPKSEIFNLDSLYVVSSIGGQLMINHCVSLQTLSGLHNLQSIGGSLIIASSINLTNLLALSNLRTIGFTLTIFNNDMITTLSGLDSLSAESISSLNISYNASLSWCAIESVCQYIANPNASVGIMGNSIGCDSVEVVESYCQHTMIPEQQSPTQLSTFPNPFTTSTTIEYELTEPSHIQLTIYNAIGGVVYTAEDRLIFAGKHSFTWSPERLPEGMYYGVLRSEEGVSVVKMVKQ